MNRADALVKDNEKAYHDYKKRELFPKISEQAHLNNTSTQKQSPGRKNKNDKGSISKAAATKNIEPMGFVEFQEKQIQDMYDLFLVVCK